MIFLLHSRLLFALQACRFVHSIQFWDAYLCISDKLGPDQSIPCRLETFVHYKCQYHVLNGYCFALIHQTFGYSSESKCSLCICYWSVIIEKRSCACACRIFSKALFHYFSSQFKLLENYKPNKRTLCVDLIFFRWFCLHAIIFLLHLTWVTMPTLHILSAVLSSMPIVVSIFIELFLALWTSFECIVLSCDVAQHIRTHKRVRIQRIKHFNLYSQWFGVRAKW